MDDLTRKKIALGLNKIRTPNTSRGECCCGPWGANGCDLKENCDCPCHSKERGWEDRTIEELIETAGNNDIALYGDGTSRWIDRADVLKEIRRILQD